MTSGRHVNLSGLCLSPPCVVVTIQNLVLQWHSRKKLLPSLPDKSHHPTSSFVFPYCTVLFMVKSFNSWTCQSCTKGVLKCNLRTLKYSWGACNRIPPSISMLIVFHTIAISLSLWFNLTTQISVATAWSRLSKCLENAYKDMEFYCLPLDIGCMIIYSLCRAYIHLILGIPLVLFVIAYYTKQF